MGLGLQDLGEQREYNELTATCSYGASLRKQVKKIEIQQHSKYTCTFCGKVTVKRHSVGIWDCKSCKKTVRIRPIPGTTDGWETDNAMNRSLEVHTLCPHPLRRPHDRQSDGCARLLRCRGAVEYVHRKWVQRSSRGMSAANMIAAGDASLAHE